MSSSIFLCAVGILLTVWLLQDRSAGKPAPPFSLREAYGERVDLESYRGRPVLLVFWTTSCPICRNELPVLNGLAPEFKDRGLVMLAINVGDADGARRFMREQQLEQLVNLVDADGEVAQKYGVRGVPKLVLVDAQGNVEKSAAGRRGADGLRAWLHRATRS